MPKNVIGVDRSGLSTFMPGTNTVASHKFIIEEVVKQLDEQGFIITKEEYVRNLNGEVAQGVYHLQYGTDLEIGLMLSWANSYDRTMSFRCGVGAYNKLSQSNIVSKMSVHRRNPNVNAEDQTKDNITDAINTLVSEYNSLVLEKDFMKTQTLTEKSIGELLGRLYFNQDILTSSQMISFKEQFKKPIHDFNVPKHSLWAVYNFIGHALKKSHPKTWMEQHAGLHQTIKEEYFPTPIITDPNQTNLVDQVEEAELDKTLNTIESKVETDKVLDEIKTEKECVDCDGENLAVEAITEQSETESTVKIIPIIPPDNENTKKETKKEETTGEFPEAPADLPVSGDTGESSKEEQASEKTTDILVEDPDEIDDSNEEDCDLKTEEETKTFSDDDEEDVTYIEDNSNTSELESPNFEF